MVEYPRSRSEDESTHAAEAEGFDPNEYKNGAAPEAEQAAPAAQPFPNKMLAGIFAQLAAAGIEADKLEAFRATYTAQLTMVFDYLEFSEGLAEYGLSMGEGGEPMPAWLRVVGGIGAAAVLAMMNRPELLTNLVEAIKRRTGASSSAPAGGGEPAGVWDDGDGVRAAA